jgi:hypothetical protein
MANFSTGDRARRPKGDRFVLSDHFMFFNFLSCLQSVVLNFSVLFLYLSNLCIRCKAECITYLV